MKARTMSQENEEEDIGESIILVIVGTQCRRNLELQKSLKKLKSIMVRHSDTGFEHMQVNSDVDVVFVLENFQGDIFRKLAKARCHIVGPTIVIECAKQSISIPIRKRPLYCTAMDQLVLCFTGFKIKEELVHLAELTHNMGGIVRRQYSVNITHLVANITNSDKFQIELIQPWYKTIIRVEPTIGCKKNILWYTQSYVVQISSVNQLTLQQRSIKTGHEKLSTKSLIVVAVNTGKPIMHMNWILKTWEENQNTAIETSATSQEMMKYKLAPFHFCVVSFIGFTREEQHHMQDVTVSNGGSWAQISASNLTHLVVSENSQPSISDEILNSSTRVVMSQWFWSSIQMNASADETMYPFVKPISTTGTTTPNGVLSASKSRKRRRLKENLAQLAQDGEVNTPMYKQTDRELHESGRKSMGASFLDVTADMSSPTTGTANNISSSPVIIGTPTSIKDLASMSFRLRIVHELFQTEKNYVGILHTILKTFKEELEKPDQIGGAIFDSQMINIIFGKIPAIYQTHIKIRDDLNELLTTSWTEESSIGDIFLRQSDLLMKCYPPFVNYFSNIKEAISRCDQSVPRFHAFQKVCLTRPECGRQSLTELMIRPVQRLPSILLILKGYLIQMLKRTDISNPDHMKLEKAISSLDDVTLHINEDKRKCEGHQEMFDIINDIENCPPILLSSHRSFITRIDVIELTDELSGRGQPLSLFVFNDCLAYCKRRTKIAKSSSTRNIGSKSLQKPFKHIEVLKLSSIKRIVDVISNDSTNVFALVVKTLDVYDERRHAFSVNDDTIKLDFLIALSKTVCDSLCRPDYEKLLTTVNSNILNIDTSDVSTWNITKVANKFSKRVSRAFSLTKTPGSLPRTTSGKITPSKNSSVSLRTGLTPSYDRGRVNSVHEMMGAVSYSDLVDQKNIGTPLRKRNDNISASTSNIFQPKRNFLVRSISKRLTKMGPPRTPLMNIKKFAPFGLRNNNVPATDDDDYDDISIISGISQRR